MNPLHEILTRNLGSRLTPELILGILHGYESAALPESVCTLIPTAEIPPPKPSTDARLVARDRARVGAWVAERVGRQAAWGGFNALGWLDKPGGELVAGVVIEGMTRTNAFLHVAFAGRCALKRGLLWATFDYVFNQLGLERVTGLVDADNAPALRFDQHLGFEHEFTIPRGNGGDVHQLVLWRERCRWIRHEEVSDG